MNGVNADSNVNADTAKSVGEKMLVSVKGTLTIDNSFKRSAQTVTIASKSSVKIEYKYKLTLNLYFRNYFRTSSAHIPQLFSTTHLC